MFFLNNFSQNHDTHQLSTKIRILPHLFFIKSDENFHYSENFIPLKRQSEKFKDKTEKFNYENLIISRKWRRRF